MSLTDYFQVNAQKPQPYIIEKAARLIKAGELVAFPTETVYGLGADAFQPAAVEKIFIAKGRPQEKPLLVHISNIKQAASLTTGISEDAQRLMKCFWPGPLSIILPAKSKVPLVVRGDGVGVGLRMPSHPVALALINAAGPLAAPSANLYGRPSPTSAKHVREDLDNIIAAVLDAGETGSGLESTLIDMCARPYKILRPGGIDHSAIAKCLNDEVSIFDDVLKSSYRTRLKIQLFADQNELNKALAQKNGEGNMVGLLTLEEHHHESEWTKHIFKLDMSEDNFNLYAILREAEAIGIDLLVVAPFDQERVGTAVMDRLRRAVGHD